VSPVTCRRCNLALIVASDEDPVSAKPHILLSDCAEAYHKGDSGAEPNEWAWCRNVALMWCSSLRPTLVLGLGAGSRWVWP
jgi:hypothetical protein